MTLVGGGAVPGTQSAIKNPRLTKTVMCRHFQKGSRKLGSACNFAYGDNDLKPYKATLCRHFANGHCNNGASCAFAHGEEDIRSSPKPHDTTKLKTKLCRHFQGFGNGNCPSGDACIF